MADCQQESLHFRYPQKLQIPHISHGNAGIVIFVIEKIQTDNDSLNNNRPVSSKVYQNGCEIRPYSAGLLYQQHAIAPQWCPLTNQHHTPIR